MEVHVFDVEHGSCNVVVAPSGETILIDCGHNDTTGWRPSKWFLNKNYEITNLTVTNTDEDHVSDLPNVDSNCTIRSLSRNWHLSADWIRGFKKRIWYGEWSENVSLNDKEIHRTAFEYRLGWNEYKAILSFSCNI